MSKAQFEQSRALIQEKRYSEARAILKTIDHPTARQWLEKLDKLSPPTQAPTSKSKPSSTDKSPNRTLLVAIGVVAVVIVVGIVAVLLLRPKQNDTAALLPTVIPTNEAIPTLEPTADLAIGSTLENPIPAGQPIVYKAGILRALFVHSPVGFALYNAKSYAPLMNNESYIGVKFIFACDSSCDNPPEAKLALIFSDGSVGDEVPVYAVDEPALYVSKDHIGWLYFDKKSSAQISALRVTSKDGTLFATLPNSVNGYLVNTEVKTLDDGTQTLRLPDLRKAIDTKYPVEDVYAIASKNNTSIVIPVVLDTLYFENEQQVVDTAFPILTTLSSTMLSKYAKNSDGITLVFMRSTDKKQTASVSAASKAFQLYSSNNLSTNDLISTLSIKIQEKPPTVGSAQNTQQPTQAPTAVPNTPVQNAGVPKTDDDFKQYLLTNYSSIAGQPLSIDSVYIFSTAPISVNINLTYDAGGWETFSNQTFSAATEYANRLTKDVQNFFGTSSDIFVSVGYSYYTKQLQDYHYDKDWWHIGDYNVDRGWYVAMDFIKGYFINGNWDVSVWNYK